MASVLEGLAVGRIVHYVLPATNTRRGDVRAAVVAQVWHREHDSHPGLSNLVVMKSQARDGGQLDSATFMVGSVSYDPEGRPGTWHWPPRAGEG